MLSGAKAPRTVVVGGSGHYGHDITKGRSVRESGDGDQADSIARAGMRQAGHRRLLLITEAARLDGGSLEKDDLRIIADRLVQASSAFTLDEIVVRAIGQRGQIPEAAGEHRRVIDAAGERHQAVGDAAADRRRVQGPGREDGGRIGRRLRASLSG